ncbi:mechanosensitive ion channel MscS [Halosimplex carlsbadense 2-9-1]|uniref:Mechanosensitive ion channel MscS n=1 Tax=Halosimplex carlsbadense 2-9-1 TaxID=797114 RepID=M0D2D3_9EURY|nr:mechanosensitive ion channel family protein [Halosimplex carlsbadense]ELZ29676.1 mechanosensitive ion channel MscS [Halosimplex carlsbadense 2-9-1]
MQTRLATDLWVDLQALPRWQSVVLVVGASLLAARLIQVGGDAAIRRLTRTIPGDVDRVVLRSVHPALYASVLAAGGYLGTRLLTTDPAWIEPATATAQTVVTVVWAVQLARMGRGVSQELTSDDQLGNRMAPIFQNVWSALLLGASAFLVLTYWSIDVTPLLASAGVMGIVIGLAARDTIANLFGSIALYTDGTYAVGDFVVLESGERGRVEDISIRSTVLRTRDDLLVTVPNSVLNTATIINESSPERERRVRVAVGVAYGSDIDHVEDTLLDVAAAESVVLDDPEPRVRMRGFGDSALDVELLCWIPAPVLRGRATHRLNKGVYRAFVEEGIEIPFPQRVVTMDGANGGAETNPAPVSADESTELAD